MLRALQQFASQPEVGKDLGAPVIIEKSAIHILASLAFKATTYGRLARDIVGAQEAHPLLTGAAMLPSAGTIAAA